MVRFGIPQNWPCVNGRMGQHLRGEHQIFSLRPRRGAHLIVIKMTTPPYEATLASNLMADPIPGAVILVQGVTYPLGPEITAEIESTTWQYPYAPLAMEIAPRHRIHPADVLRLRTLFSVRAILLPSDPDRKAQLRSQLSDPDSLRCGLGHWLRRVGLSVPDQFVAAAFEVPPGSLSAITSTQKRRGLPPLREWRAVLKAVQVAVDLQRFPQKSILRTALEHNYQEHSSYTHAVRRHFGTNPRTARHALGWEWMIWTWLKRRGLVPVTPKRAPLGQA
jgi:hypothetical protein